LFDAIGINNRCRDVIALLGAGGDGFSGKRGRKPMRGQNILRKCGQCISEAQTSSAQRRDGGFLHVNFPP
jgi:hypothetical protein